MTHMRRIMALDLGTTRTGVAITDPAQIIAQPLTVLGSADGASFHEALQRLVAEYQVERVIVGIPFSLNGRRGPMAHWAEGIRRRLAGALPVPVEPWDERLSSLSADRTFHDTGLFRSQGGHRQDAAAAAYILQGYLDRLHVQHERQFPGPHQP